MDVEKFKPDVPDVDLSGNEALRESFVKVGSIGAIAKGVIRTIEILGDTIIPEGNSDKVLLAQAIATIKKILSIWIGLTL